jgi:hypothetical protein
MRLLATAMNAVSNMAAAKVSMTLMVENAVQATPRM